MKIIGIIPARKGSKRLPDKNLRLLGGKPLVCRSIETALRTSILDDIAVSTDSDEILSFAKNYNSPGITFIKRPSEISNDSSPAIDYVHHVLDYYSNLGKEFDAVVILQPSSPFTDPEDILCTVELLNESDSAVSVVKVPHDINPVKMKLFDGKKLVPYVENENGRMTADTLPEVYVRNCSVYASRIDLIKSGKIISENCLGYEMPRERSVDINDEFDLKYAEFLISSG